MKDELIELQNEYILLLEKELGNFAAMAYNRGIKSSQEAIKKGERLREEINKLTT